MTEKKNPGGEAGATEGTLREFGADHIGHTAAPSLRECPAPLTSVRFPGMVAAIRRARTKGESWRAVASFAHAGMFVRHVIGAYNPMSRDAIANEAWTYVRLSPAAKEVRAIDVAAIVALMDDAVRERYDR